MVKMDKLIGPQSYQQMILQSQLIFLNLIQSVVLTTVIDEG